MPAAEGIPLIRADTVGNNARKGPAFKSAVWYVTRHSSLATSFITRTASPVTALAKSLQESVLDFQSCRQKFHDKRGF